MGMGLNHTLNPLMNVSPRYKVVLSLEEKPENYISTIWQMNYYLHQNILY